MSQNECHGQLFAILGSSYPWPKIAVAFITCIDDLISNVITILGKREQGHVVTKLVNQMFI